MPTWLMLIKAHPGPGGPGAGRSSKLNSPGFRHTSAFMWTIFLKRSKERLGG
jgi:hypothetical protein